MTKTPPPAPECRLGSPGCACEPDGDCDGALSCVANVCKAANCAGTSEGCPCGDDSACDTGLTCNESDYCEDPTGRGDGPCYANRTCDSGFACNSENVCQACTHGSEGCACLTNGTCNTGLACSMGTCAAPGSMVRSIPQDPKCYTPCRTGFVDSTGTYRACSPEGLMDGCIDDQTCTNGACVESGASRVECSNDTQCTDFQRCISGSCYSDCEYDSDCSAAERCSRQRHGRVQPVRGHADARRQRRTWPPASAGTTSVSL